MIGHQQIIEARKDRLKPSSIFFDAGFEPMPCRFDFENPELALAHNLHPTVTLPLGDLRKRQDVRFVAGCKVIVNGISWSDNLMAFLDNLTACAPAAVFACCINESQEVMHWQNGEWRIYA